MFDAVFTSSVSSLQCNQSEFSVLLLRRYSELKHNNFSSRSSWMFISQTFSRWWIGCHLIAVMGMDPKALENLSLSLSIVDSESRLTGWPSTTQKSYAVARAWQKVLSNSLLPGQLLKWGSPSPDCVDWRQGFLSSRLEGLKWTISPFLHIISWICN